MLSRKPPKPLRGQRTVKKNGPQAFFDHNRLKAAVNQWIKRPFNEEQGIDYTKNR